jgi:hypothetical protein
LFDIADSPEELRVAIAEFFPEEEWNNAASISKLESNWDAFALANTVDESHPCGAFLRVIDGIRISAERSVGYFQINSCLYPDWEWQRLYNARHNVGTAHMLWAQRRWQPWFFSAKKLGLL